MSWLKSLNYKRFLKIPGWDFSLVKHRISLMFSWNQTTKILTGLLASVFSMISLLTFFGSLEELSSVKPSSTEEASMAFELGESDALSLEFGLDASLPLRESESATASGNDAFPPRSAIKAVSVQQVEGTVQNDSNVYHALGHEFENRKSGGQVQQITGERPVYIDSLRPAGVSSRSTGVGAVWLTGEIEETDDLPANGSARRVRNN